MTTYKSTIIPIRSTFEQQPDNQLLRYKLKWRQRQLLVSLEKPNNQLCLAQLRPLETQWLVECLKHSYVKLIRIDAALGEVTLKWVDACEKANKAVFLRLPPTIKLPKQQRSLSLKLMQLLDSIIAALLLLVLSPVILVLLCLLRLESSEPIFQRQWHVGERGKLFRLFKFRTVINPDLENQSLHPKNLKRQKSSITNLDNWIRKYKLDRIPQLFNVVRGEIRLFNPRLLTLELAIKLSIEETKNEYVSN